MVIRAARPYAAKALVEFEFDTDQLNIFVTFRFGMEESVKPANTKWIVKVDNVVKAVTVSAWVDGWTMLLTVPNIAVIPDRVTLKYNGPDENLRTTWDKQWEPWGPIVATQLQPTITSRTFSTGPAPQDDVDVSNVRTLFLDCSGNAIVIGAFQGGVNNQILHICRIDDNANAATLEHNELTANQNIFLHAGLDETLNGEYGGWCLACDGSNWFDMSHSKHV